ncbi:leucine-rich repeat protein soc-2 homolog, partial [Mytilus californianus]|uniref:leucine-rich repeat protein soc-2 homolog n=1 Tax=Mytilus californianus TaxID=6549 RepID=UPI002245D596
SFILCDGCPASPPCKCQSIAIFCANLNLTSVPDFTNPIGNDSGWDLELHDNEITQIRYGDLKNLKLRRLFLSNNKINVIENGALTGSEDFLLVLHLSNNKLTSIPSDVGRLKHLTDLDIHDNPMENMNEEIIRNISGSLLSLSLGNDIMTSWPQCLERLTNLTSMSIFSLNIPKIYDDVFDNYSHLNILEIISTNLSSIPTSIGKLLNLQNVNLYNNLILAEESFPLHIFRDLHNLSSISIVNCSLRSLPLTFSEISSLSFLVIENNPISYVEDGVFERNVSSKVWFMALKTTKLTSIPRTISNLTGLQFLNLKNGLIEEIKTEDFQNLKKLERLFLSGNPIRSISEEALMDLESLESLILDNTNLTTVPTVVLNLPSIMGLSLENNGIMCTCKTLRWMKDWPRLAKVLIVGSCVNIRITITDYIKQELPKCEL